MQRTGRVQESWLAWKEGKLTCSPTLLPNDIATLAAKEKKMSFISKGHERNEKKREKNVPNGVQQMVQWNALHSMVSDLFLLASMPLARESSF
ncbi:hypothetical protein CDAR_392511 [Caerostris darwini]|uniref:Uncharacterized protein n=1 Tax=Caerostris darwini TaxID=1538125 RepID=A0AAV4NTP6_9ARAC|nr:hypothetical protein CDAR_392511 [Caerostris darwini]